MADGDLLRINAGHQEFAAPTADPFAAASTHIADADTDLATNLSPVLLADLVTAVNATNTRVNDLAGRVNALYDILEAHGQLAAS